MRRRVSQTVSHRFDFFLGAVCLADTCVNEIAFETRLRL